MHLRVLRRSLIAYVNFIFGLRAPIWDGLVYGVRVTVSQMGQVNHFNELVTMHMGPGFVLVTSSLNFSNDIGAKVLKDKVRELT